MYIELLELSISEMSTTINSRIHAARKKMRSTWDNIPKRLRILTIMNKEEEEQ